MSNDPTPTDLAPVAAARAETAETVAERVRDMLRRCRLLEDPLLEDPLTETRAGLAEDHYTFDVRYLVGAIQTLVAERAHVATETAEHAEEQALLVLSLREERDSAVNDADEYRQALRQAEDDVVQLTADLERAPRG